MQKFSQDDQTYFNYIGRIKEEKTLDPIDVIYNFPVYVGSVNLARLFFFYEVYQKVQNCAGDLADVGTYKGASLFTFAKLLKLFEPYSQTRVHGFDWFKGMKIGQGDDPSQQGRYVADKAEVENLLQLQGLDGFAQLHDLDLTRDLPVFLAERPWLRFKLIFVDCGIRDVMQSTFEHLYPRLSRGGIVILDHYCNEASPSESDIVSEFAPNETMLQIPYSRSPSAYFFKNN